MKLIDTHCHLDFDELVRDRDGVLARAQGGGRGAHDHHLHGN